MNVKYSSNCGSKFRDQNSYYRASDFFQEWWAQVTHGAKKMVGYFLKWWAQAYQTNRSWHLGSILYLNIDTDTCMLTADYTVKPVLSGNSKKKTNYRSMQVKSIAECSKGSILQSFRPSLCYHLFCLFLSGCLRHVLLYWLLTCTFCFVEFVDSLYNEYFY